MWHKSFATLPTKSEEDELVVTAFTYKLNELLTAEEKGTVVKDIERLGEMRIDLNAICFDSDSENNLPVNLKTLSQDLDGVVNITFTYSSDLTNVLQESRESELEIKK